MHGLGGNPQQALVRLLLPAPAAAGSVQLRQSLTVITLERNAVWFCSKRT